MNEEIDINENHIGRSRQRKNSGDINRLLIKIAKKSVREIERLLLPEDIQEELISAKQIKSPKARNRQIKFVGGLIRNHEKCAQMMATFDLKYQNSIDQ